MKRVAFLVGVAAALLAAHPASADTLVYADGAKATGKLDELVLLVSGVQGIYGRKAVASVQLGKDGQDLVVLRSDLKRQGHLLSVRFTSPTGVVTVPRKAIASIELNEDFGTPPQAAPDEPTPQQAQPQKKETPDQAKARQDALTKNHAMWEYFSDKADDLKKQDYQALRQKYWDQCEKVVQDIQRLQQTIDRKEHRRSEAMARWRRERERALRDDRRRRRIPARPQHRDGLENDQRALRQALQKKAQLKSKIDAEQDAIAEKARALKHRVLAVYGRHKTLIEGGKLFSVEEMRAHYEAALGSLAPQGGRDDRPGRRAQKDDAQKKRKQQRQRRDQKNRG